MSFETLKTFNNTKPFNDLWPPTDLESYQVDIATLRYTWFHWLKNGWINNIPYRKFKVWYHHPNAIKEKKRRRIFSKIWKRRDHRQTAFQIEQRRFRQLRARRTGKSNLEVQDQEQD